VVEIEVKIREIQIGKVEIVKVEVEFKKLIEQLYSE
jgi:hypothetical protein